MSYNYRGGRGGYSHRGYRGGNSGGGGGSGGGYRGSYRSNRPPPQKDDRYTVGGMLKLNKGAHYESSDNRYIPGENGSRSPEVKATKPPVSDGNTNTTSGLNTPMSSLESKVLTPISTTTTTQVPGTDKNTGVNEKDAEFPKLSHHSDFTDLLPASRPTDPRKNFKVLYDNDPSKHEKKLHPKKVRYNGEGIHSHEVTDPRLSNFSLYMSKPNKKSKKFPHRQLPQPKIVYDKDSIGYPPLATVVLWDLPISATEQYLRNYLMRYGDAIETLDYKTDPATAVPLGVVTFKFQGSPEKSAALAKKFLKIVHNEEPKIDGAPLRARMNDNENLLLNKKMEDARQKLLQQRLKREEEDKKRHQKILEEQKKQELLKKKQEEEQKKQEEAKRKAEQESIQAKNSVVSTRNKNLVYKPNSTVLSIRRKHKIVRGVILPKELDKYIKNRPYILIHDKHVPTKKISSQDIKRFLKKYDWTRVLSDKTGFYIVFNSLNECERCFLNEDAKKFFEYKLVMELAIPEGFSPNGKENESKSISDVFDEATNILIKEFQTFLAKDIRERIIAPNILDLLGHEHYPKLVEELKAQEQASKPKILVSNNNLKQNALSILEKQRQELQERLKKRKKKNQIVPMLHALDIDSESESESDEEDEDEEEEEEEEDNLSRPLSPGTKRERSSTFTSVDDEAEEQERITKKLKVEEKEEAVDEVMEDVQTKEETTEEIPLPGVAEEIDDRYMPTEGEPQTVYPEFVSSGVFDLDELQGSLKDEEDLALAQEVLAETEPLGIKDIDYWSWKLKDIKSADEIAEEVENIEELPADLESSTGAFKSEGYKKIPDPAKIGYLPHRRKADKPIKTIQYEDDDDEKPNENSNTVQSSRVNRANNRRFAADITAQIGSESDVLSLNALTKRKKPVTFARSAIHNWGLYALEPIAAKEMIIEYVGERIRQQVAEHREKSYLKTGIGSSYLFRIDENTVIDATKKGGIARFINHCCSPSCTAKIIKVEGIKRIVIYALRDIEANEELTYDYKFERETNDEERIRCLCGAPGCKGYLN
ncbi:Histone-lysine N-methyltransferase, H3 lysine-4 specific [Candida viswanathii]|uniref:Histone-lysine N-methyltransferase, H3 lysine-4 specific n=1 Tax=Candida viswanathii TaxID=5486 RepID=A0A367Y534_9ASCO|nr:Histone-lysine N-methyltransferase, H3 lysine-4 specific [Candida viswanathii]